MTMKRFLSVIAGLSFILILSSVSCGKDKKSPTEPSGPTNYTITGKILEKDTGIPKVSVNIKGTRFDKTVTTNECGSYRFSNIPDGTYEIIPGKNGYIFNPSSIIVFIANNDSVVQNIKATKLGGDGPHEVDGIIFVPIPTGTFQMGNIQGGFTTEELPVHTVTLDAFEMSMYEITNAQYIVYLNEELTSGNIIVKITAVIGTHGEYSGEDYLDIDDPDCEIRYNNGTFIVESGLENHPVIEVTWYGAKAFALSYGFDLSTEAEWEYACRAGTTTTYNLGNDESDLARAGWYYGNAYDWTHPVGQKELNAWGLCDMHGNVWEWCHDWYDVDYYSSSPMHNPTGAENGSYRVVRGGCWFNDPSGCRSANRNDVVPDGDTDGLGIRVVRRGSGMTL